MRRRARALSGAHEPEHHGDRRHRSRDADGGDQDPADDETAAAASRMKLTSSAAPASNVSVGRGAGATTAPSGCGVVVDRPGCELGRDEEQHADHGRPPVDDRFAFARHT